MDSALKQRLVGATVLVALGVIFIPMLLERGSEDSRLSVQMEIPPEPDTRFKDHTGDADSAGDIEPLAPIEQSIASVKAQQQADRSGRPADAKPASTTPAEPADGKAGTQTAARSESEPESKPEPPPASPPEADQGEWIVQVGSFSRQANAEVLRDKLKSGGFNAFMETAQASTGPVYRVRVGPQEKRADAEALVQRLNEQGGYRGIVMSYSP